MGGEVEPMTEEEVERFRAANAATVFPDHGYLRLLATLDAERAALEVERMRLVACDTVAMADTESSAALARDMAHEYRSAALESVIRRVDECIALRARSAALEGLLGEALCYVTRGPGHTLAPRIDAALKGGGR